MATREPSLSQSYPHLALEWDSEANAPLMLDQMTRGSKKKVIWRCQKNHAHVWPARVDHRVNGIGCPYCSGRYVTPDRSLQALYPELAAEMHPTLNGTLRADQIAPKGDVHVVWQCRRNPEHIWTAVVKSRVRGNGCRKCAHKEASPETSLFTLYPELVKEWHPTKNTLTPHDVVPGSEKKVWWQCKNDPTHEWPAMIRNRAILGSGCHICTRQVATPETSFLALYPELAEEFDYEANVDVRPELLLPHSNKKVWWRCRYDPTHTWPTTIASRVNGTGCSFCRGQRATYTTSLSVLYPELAKEWHPTMNGSRRPDQVRPRSGLVVYWQCQKDSSHVWKARVQHRANGIGCRYCSGQEATPETSLATLHPNIAAEWHPEANGDLTPWQVKPRSNLKVIWQCSRDSSHVWDAIIDNRVSHGSGCPHCRPVMGSSLEDAFALVLDEYGVEYQHQKPIGNCHVDFYLPAYNLVIEIQGCYWHGCLLCGYDDEQDQVKRVQDAKRHTRLHNKGYIVKELWEHTFFLGEESIQAFLNEHVLSS